MGATAAPPRPSAGGLSPRPQPALPAPARKWWTLGTLSVAVFMITLDNTIVNVALPAIQRDLAITIAGLEWVVTVYALTFAVLMLSGGKLADRSGRRRVFLGGLIVFTAGSLAAGFAASAGFLIGARGLMGVGAALMLPATLAIITVTFPREQRGLAVGVWGGVSALGLAVGPVVGGLLTESVGWSWIFFINVPIGVLALVLARVLIAESRDERATRRFDVPGLLASGFGLFALVFALIEAGDRGWGSPTIVACLVVSVTALALFAVIELRTAQPMVDVTLFRDSTFAGANIVGAMLMFTAFGVFFFLSLYMQTVLGWSAVETGLAFLPMTGLIMVVAPVVGKISDHVGPRWLMSGSMLLTAAASVLFTQLETNSGFARLLPGLLLAGIGLAGTLAPATTAVLRAIPESDSGVASGLYNAFRQVGGTLGVAVMGAVLASALGAGPQGFVDGMAAAFWVSAGVALAGAIVAAVVIRSGRVEQM